MRSFEDLRTADCTIYDTLKNAAIAMNLVEAYEEYHARSIRYINDIVDYSFTRKHFTIQ